MDDNRKRNLIQYGPNWTPELAREYGRRGGMASGESRRKRADFKKNLNALLTAEIDSPEWRGMLESMGLECTLESAMLMAAIKQALAGDMRAWEMVAKYSGQSGKTDAEDRESLANAIRSEVAAENEKIKAQLDQARAELAAAQADLAQAKAEQARGHPDEEQENPFAGLTTEELRKLVAGNG